MNKNLLADRMQNLLNGTTSGKQKLMVVASGQILTKLKIQDRKKRGKNLIILNYDQDGRSGQTSIWFQTRMLYYITSTVT